jgi:TIR domain
MKIFLAYASEEKDLAESIALSLRGRAYEVFLDRDDLPVGVSYDQQIERAVKASDIFVFLISPASVAEGRYTRSELAFARQKWLNPSGHVLPVLARDTSLTNVPAYLKSVTILEPQGSIPAETSAAIDKMRTVIETSRGWRRVGYRTGAMAAAAVLLAAAAVSSYNYLFVKVILPEPLNRYPYGIYLAGITEAQRAVQEAKKVKTIARSIGREDNEIRLYKRPLPDDTYLWAIIITYTDANAASADVPKYDTVRNGWNKTPQIVNIKPWCPKSKPIRSPTGSDIEFPTLDCT